MKRTFGRRPARLGRVFATSPLYFVTFCTHERQRFLAKNEVHNAFVVFAKRATDNFNVAVGRYVIMPDHVHFFLRGSDNFRLGAWIGGLKQALAKAAMLSRRNGQIWEEGFFDHILRSNESYAQNWNYVRENPVRAGLVKISSGLALPGRDRLHRSRLISCSHRPVAGSQHLALYFERPTGPWLQG